MQDNKKGNKLTFEVAIKRLEEIVEKLDEGEIPLEDSIRIFEEGMNLIDFCQNKLKEVEKKVEIIMKKREEEKGEDENS
jgi:exodeoxyribonuclease VII small subunit